MILTYIQKLYQKISLYSKKIYGTSKLKVINDKAVSSAISASSKSFICGFMSSEPKTNKHYSESLVGKAVSTVASFFALIGQKTTSLFEKSIIFRFCSFIAKNIFDFPVRIFGVFLLLFGLTSASHMFFDTLQPICILTIVLSAVAGAVMIFVDTSFNRILYTSKLYGLAIKFLSKKELDNTFCDKDVSELPLITYICTSVVAILCGVLSYFISPVIILGGIIAFIGVILFIKDFRIGTYATILLFPFLPTMIIVGMLLLSLISLVIRCMYDREFKPAKTGIDIYIILFSVIIAISGITSFDRATSINIALVYIVFILSYFLFTNTLSDKSSLYTAFSMLITSGIIVSLYGIYQYVFGFSEGSVWIDTGMFSEIETRVVSTFENPNVLGEYLIILIPLSIAYFFESGSIKEKWASVFAAAILVLCMVFTFSRGCWIGLIVSLGVMSLFYDRRFVWAGIILLLFSPLYLPESIIQRFLSVGNTSDTSTSYRVYIWFGTIDMLKDYWLTGIGLGEGAFNVIYPHYSYSAIIAPHSHNLYLQIMVENGIVGFILFAIMIIAFYKNSIYALTKTKRSFLKVSLLGLVAAITGYLIQGLFDNVWYNYRVFMFFFMTLAITIKCSHIAMINELKSRGESDD